MTEHDNNYEIAIRAIETARHQRRNGLNLSGLKLTDLPESIFQLTQIVWLDLNDNELTIIPEAIGKLCQLHTLELGQNKLTTIPESIGRLSNLEKLNLSGNKLINLPDSLGDLKSLKVLCLHDNDTLGIPVEFVGPVAAKCLVEIDREFTKRLLDYYYRTKWGFRELSGFITQKMLNSSLHSEEVSYARHRTISASVGVERSMVCFSY